VAEPSPPPTRASSFVRSVARPLTTYLDHRFDDLRASIERRLDAIEAGVADTGELRTMLASAHQALEAQTAATRELATAVEQFARAFAARADDVAGALGALVERAEQALGADPRGTRASP
jgi:hypothetical protein